MNTWTFLKLIFATLLSCCFVLLLWPKAPSLDYIVITRIFSNPNLTLSTLKLMTNVTIPPTPPVKKQRCSYESQVRCKGPCCDVTARERSCEFTNLYHLADSNNNSNNEYLLYRLKSSPRLPDYTVMLMARTPVHKREPRNSHNWSWYPSPDYPFFSPRVVLFSTCAELVAAASGVQFKPGKNVLFYVNHSPWNWGHAMLDDFYPHALAQIRMGNILDNFTFLIHAQSPQFSRAKLEVYETMAMYAGRPFDHMSRWNGAYIIRNVIVGVGPHAARTPTKDYVMAGRELRAMHLIRDRIYRTAGLTIPSRRLAGPNRTMRALFIANKRDIGNVTQHIIAVQKELGDRVMLQAFNFQDYTFLQQLQLFRETDIYVSGVGTALVAAFLMPDRSAVLNLGDIREGSIVAFWEENVLASLDYLQVFYADPRKRRRGVRSEDLASQLGTIEMFLRTNFTLPISREANLSPLGLVVSDYFGVDPDAHLRMIGALSSPSSRDCSRQGWAEFLVCRRGFWGGKECGEIDENALARFRESRGVDAYCSSLVD